MVYGFYFARGVFPEIPKKAGFCTTFHEFCTGFCTTFTRSSILASDEPSHNVPRSLLCPQSLSPSRPRELVMSTTPSSPRSSSLPAAPWPSASTEICPWEDPRGGAQKSRSWCHKVNWCHPSTSSRRICDTRPGVTRSLRATNQVRSPSRNIRHALRFSLGRVSRYA